MSGDSDNELGFDELEELDMEQFDEELNMEQFGQDLEQFEEEQFDKDPGLEPVEEDPTREQLAELSVEDFGTVLSVNTDGRAAKYELWAPVDNTEAEVFSSGHSSSSEGARAVAYPAEGDLVEEEEDIEPDENNTHAEVNRTLQRGGNVRPTLMYPRSDF